MKKFISHGTVSLQHIKDLISRNLHPEALKFTISLASHPNRIFDQTYALSFKYGHGLPIRLATALVTHFAKSGDFERSLGLLLDTHEPDTVAFTSLLSGYAQFNQTASSFALYERLLRNGLRPCNYTLSSLVKSCEVEREIAVAHGICVKVGVNANGFVVSGLVQKYGRCGCVDSAWKSYGECLVLDDVVCTAMINACVWNGQFAMGREIFAGIRDLGLEFNEFSLTAVIGTISDNVEEGEQIHGLSVKMGLLDGRSIHLSNALMSMYCRFGSRAEAFKVFDEITLPDVVSWTVRVGASCDGREAFEVFKNILSSNMEMNELTLINLLATIEGPSLLMPGKQVHSFCYKRAYIMVVSVGNALISMYGKCNIMDDARGVSEELVFHDTVSWNCLIGGYSQNGQPNLVLATFCEMRRKFIQPDQYTLASLLGSMSGSHVAKFVMQIHSHIIRAGSKSDDSVFSALVTSYGKCNRMDDAKKLFSEVTKISMLHFHVMAATALEVDCFKYVLDLFESLRTSCIKVDSVAYSLVLKACSSLTNLGLAKSSHCLALKSGFLNNGFVESAVVDAYCKCGNIADAEEAFRDLSNENLAAWNAMIMGYAQHSRYHEVLNLFKEMNNLGIKPDEITYIGILNSCCHAGLVKEAGEHLQSMFVHHGVTPCLEHYSCVIDLLGRVGLLKEAKNTIDQMPIKPDAHVWQSLLSACNIYGDLRLGKLAAQELLNLEPENDSAYVLLSSLYARTKDWDAVGLLRREMRNKYVSKEPGYSWIEVEGSMRYFLAEDSSHPESEKIYLGLQSLYKQILPLLPTEEDILSAWDV